MLAMENFYTESIEELTDEQLAQVTGGAGPLGIVALLVDQQTAGGSVATAGVVLNQLGKSGGLGQTVLTGNGTAQSGLSFATGLLGSLAG
jgi:lactobin A/cerein 7B family class IIb bacteriocin